MYIHLCKGLTRCINALKYNEIMRSYAGITRIRFMGMISATVSRAPLHCKFINYFNITDEMFRISDILCFGFCRESHQDDGTGRVSTCAVPLSSFGSLAPGSCRFRGTS